MPYTAIKKEMVDGKEKWCFRNKATGQRICSDTEEGAKAAMRARYAHAQEMELPNHLVPELNPMIKLGEE